MENKSSIESLSVFKINQNVLASTIPFSWAELDCFFRPFAIAFKSFNKDYFDLFLMWVSFIRLYMYKEFSEKYDSDYIQYYNENLSHIFGISITNKEVRTKLHFHYEVSNNIFLGNLVALPSDLYLLPYNPAYKQKHHVHTFLVKGYDLDKELYYIMDNAHLEAGASYDYVDFYITFDDLFNTNKLYGEYFERGNNRICIMEKHSDTEEYFYNSIKKLSELIDNKVSTSSSNYLELSILEEFKRNGQVTDLTQKLEIINLRIVFLKCIINIFKKLNVKEKDICYIKNQGQKIIKQWALIKNQILYSLKTSDFDFDVAEEIKCNIQQDYEWIKKLKSIANNVDFSLFSNKYNKKYVLKNNNDAECIIENNILRIIHKDDVIYDLWTFQDNAFQLLFPVSNMSIKFSVKLYSPSELRNPTHFGIFISLEDQSKILFGNEGNYKISILNTSIPQNPNIYTKDYYSLNESILKIEINNNIGQFYIRDLKTEDWELIFSTEFDCNVNFIGIFSKTWEYTKQISEFSNLNLEINSKIIFQSNDWGSILHEKEL